MNCPVCNVELKMADRQGVEIDYCPQCRGVWLDRGELDKIVERAAAYDEESVPPMRAERKYRDNSDDDYDYDDDQYRRDDRRYAQSKRKRSKLDKLFDIFD